MQKNADETSISVFGYDLSPKGVQPRLVFLLLLGGSAAGIWLSHWGKPPGVRAVWWLLVVGLGLLVGGLYWRLVLFDATAFEAAETARYVRQRWRHLETLSVWTVALAGSASVWLGVIGPPFDIGELTLTIGIALSPVLWFGIYRFPVNATTRIPSYFRVLLFTVVLASLGGFTWVETGGIVTEWSVRTAHVGVFALWIGGAGWHNLVVLPTVKSHPEGAETIKSQARRFRRYLPVVITVVFLSGTYQAVKLVGYSPTTFLKTPIGRLIGFKLAILVVLTGLVVVTLKRARKTSCATK